MDGAHFQPDKIFALHFPLTEKELEKCRLLGKTTESIIRKVADEIKPGMLEQDIAAMFAFEYASRDMNPEVLLIGSDERIAKYRHPNPTGKMIEKLVLLHPVVKKWGLHANVTRMVCFGKPNEIFNKRYDAASIIELAAMTKCVAGRSYSDILATQKNLYASFGFPEEWRNHYQGAVTGYFLSNTFFYKEKNSIIEQNQAWDLFITITGAKVEELALNTSRGLEVPSVSGSWPLKEYSYEGNMMLLPDILVR